MVSIAAFQAVDPGSIPGPRSFCCACFYSRSYGVVVSISGCDPLDSRYGQFFFEKKKQPMHSAENLGSMKSEVV